MEKARIGKSFRAVLWAWQISFISVLCAIQIVALGVPAANAQGQTAKELILALERRSEALEAIGGLERTAARIVYVESVALLAHYGGWPGEGDAAWQGKNANSDQVPKFFYDVNNLHLRLTPEVATLRRNASRSAVFTGEELERFMALVDELEQLIIGSRNYYGLLEAGDIDEANDYFRGTIRAHYLTITAGSYTLSSGVVRDIDRISREARSAE